MNTEHMAHEDMEDLINAQEQEIKTLAKALTAAVERAQEAEEKLQAEWEEQAGASM